MLTVTESAREHLKEMLEANIDDPDACLRLVASGRGQFGLTADKERADDQVVEHEGDKVLLVESELSDALEGVTIDCQETPEGRSLVVSKE